MSDEQETLRDKFAAAALIGIITSSYTSEMRIEEMATEAYRFAASMLAERIK